MPLGSDDYDHGATKRFVKSGLTRCQGCFANFREPQCFGVVEAARTAAYSSTPSLGSTGSSSIKGATPGGVQPLPSKSK